MKRILKINVGDGDVRTSANSKNKPSMPPSPSESSRRKFSLSSLTSTPPRTTDEVHQAIAQGRFAELKPEQA